MIWDTSWLTIKLEEAVEVGLDFFDSIILVRLLIGSDFLLDPYDSIACLSQ